jgi:hypothetical protein
VVARADTYADSDCAASASVSWHCRAKSLV